MKISKEAFEKLIKEDINWLYNNTKDDLERRHIIDILNESIKYYYKN